MNLIADSGAILMTLMPLPRHNDLTPPSLIDHLAKATGNMHAIALGCMNLKKPDSVALSHKSTLAVISVCYFSFTCMSTLSLSSGAVQVRDTAPAPPPATRCRHNMPVCFSSAVNSSGTIKLSPTSKICKKNQIYTHLLFCYNCKI